MHAENLGRGIAGYFSSADEYSRLANEFSNEKEMFYINLSWLNSATDYEYYETVLAHEFQHMIHWHNDRNEETWLNEGLSEFAQEVAGYDPDLIFARSFFARPDTQLNAWNDSNKSNSAHYGSAYLFVSYLSQRFGPELVRALVAEPANGAAGVNVVLAESGYDLTFEDVFADWVVANYVDDVDTDVATGRYGYMALDPGRPDNDLKVQSLPLETITSTVSNYAVDYVSLDLNGDVLVDFQGRTETRLAATSPYSGQLAWWSNRGDDSDTRLTRRFDFSDVGPGTPIHADVKMWWEIEEGYDYGYALASRDGEQWSILPGRYTTLVDTTGNSFGAAYTATSDADSGAWVTEQYDLSAYAGESVYLRFEYVTDDAVNKSGWLIDDISIPAIDYRTDFESGPDGWESEGWLLTDNRLEQRWLLQLLEFAGRELVDVRRISVDADGRAQIAVDGLGWRQSAVLAVTAFAPVTTEPAEYRLAAERAE